MPAEGACRLPERAVSPAFLRGEDGLLKDARLSAASVRHGFTTRPLGDMADPARRRAFFGSLGLKDETGLWLKQVHGDRVVRWPEDLASQGDGAPLRADGWIAAAPSRPLCVYTADCAPLLLWDATLRFGGVFHVGWRGAAAGLPRSAAASLREAFGVRPADLRACVGPHIRPCCFKVGPEVAERFNGRSVVERPGGPFVDLAGEIAAQLVEAGLDRASVALSPECTCCRPEAFYSFRRDKARDSLMAFLVLEP
ncbi:MAG: polyphenol oxidase family protein [Elusimicrobia bacterium]|nr:polyphenol oxidase family protein [Elusimicrobiota bacterium]